jgi:hypothetical protein
MWPRYRGAARHSVKCWLNTRHKRNSRKNFSLTVDESSSDGFTSVEHSADSSHPILRPFPAMSPNTEILDAYDPDLGYDAENSPDQQNEREKRLICSAWLLAR